MKKNTLRSLLCLALLGCMLVLCACPGGEPPVVTPPDPPENGEGDDTVIFEDGKPIEGAGDNLAADAAVLTAPTYDEANAQDVPGGNFWRVATNNFGAGKVLRATGENATRIAAKETKPYDAKGSVLLFPNGVELSGCEGMTLKNAVIVGNVTITKSTDILFENVKFVGDVTVAKDASAVVFKSCRLDGATPLTVRGDRSGAIYSYIGYTACGLLDEAADTVIAYCRFEGKGTAILSTAADASYTYNTITVSEAEEAISLRGVKNAVAGMNVIRGAQKSVSLQDVRNVSVLRNSLISVNVENSHAVYVCDNAMGGRLEAKNNDYLLADGNTYPEDGKSHTAKDENNDHRSGDTLLDVDKRLEVGANEELLPQVDKELFVGMERKQSVRRLEGGDLGIYSYIMEAATANNVVLLTPGKYSSNNVGTNFTAEHNHTTIYGYGVYIEGERGKGELIYQKNHIRALEAEDLTFKGLAFGYEQQSCGQVYVLAKQQKNKLLVVTGAGMWNEFADSTPGYFDTVGIGIQRAGTFYAIGDFSVKQNGVQKNSDGTMTLTVPDDVHDLVNPGDIMTCRLKSGTSSVSFEYCKDIVFKDITNYGHAAGFAFYEGRSYTGTTYYRVYNTTKNGPIIDEETYLRYLAYESEYGVDLEISIDSEGRYRGSLPHIGSIDATNVNSCAVGAQVTSCLFENMCDDGTNQNSGHARLSEVIDNGDGTTTIIYKGALSAYLYDQNEEDSVFSRFCQPFRVGDIVHIYTSAGQEVCKTPALSVSEKYDKIMSTHPDVTPKEIQRYAVTIATEDFKKEAIEGYNLADDHHKPDEKIMVDNRSFSSSNFKFDNMIVQNTRSRGLLIKGSNGTVQNCTLRNIAKVAVAIIYEIQWGESGVSENVRVERNLIDNTSYSPGGGDSTGIGYPHIPIDIMGLGGGRLDADYLLFNNIYIIGNKFINRNITRSPYAMYIRAARDVYIRDNDFGSTETDDFRALLLNGAQNIELSGNLYPPSINAQIEYYIEGQAYKDIYGDDVGDLIPDNK